MFRSQLHFSNVVFVVLVCAKHVRMLPHKPESGGHGASNGGCPLDKIFLEIIHNDAMINQMLTSNRLDLLEEVLKIGKKIQEAGKK
uniref:Secreted protein n=1 Tax=Steinernema glaseri TaxID=37863 RepID=A0A1I7ZY58_9BILA